MYKVLKDERIQKAEKQLLSKLYPLFLVLAIGVGIIKLFITTCWWFYMVEIVAIGGSVFYYVVASSKRAVLFANVKDEYTLEIKHIIGARSFNFMFWVYIIGELIVVVGAPFIVPTNQLNLVAIYFLVWGIPALIVTVYSIKNGIFIWGSKKKEKEGLQAFKKRTIMGALCFGAFMSMLQMLGEGRVSIKGVVMIGVYALLWGIPFCFVMKWMIKISEKKADQKVKLAEEGRQDEEQENENNENRT